MSNEATRFSNSFCAQWPGSLATGAMLVKVYPARPLDPPIELSDQSVMVGRDESCKIHISAASVSRQHAELTCDAGRWTIRDLDSTNGTFVDEKPCKSAELRCGDRLRFGSQIYKFVTLDGVESKYHEIVFKLMTTDGLTQVYNKRFLLDSLEREIANACRNQQSIALLVMDLDKFKSINDTYGHLAGDAVLVEFAQRSQGVLRTGEILARFGGEEFCLLCSPVTVQQAVVAAERLRSAIAASPVCFQDIQIPVTVSIGVACYDGRHPIEPTQLIAQADTKLYLAKQNGRNRVEC